MKIFRSRIFSRIVPTVKDIGLWGPQVQEAFAAMGAIEFANVDAGALLENDARVAEEFDARMRLGQPLPMGDGSTFAPALCRHERVSVGSPLPLALVSFPR